MARNIMNIVFLFLVEISCLLLLVDCFENLVIDLENWDTQVNLNRAHKSGIQAVIHKLSEGLRLSDKKYKERRRRAEASGLLWGASHVGSNKNGTLQAIKFLEAVVEDGKYPLMVLVVRPGYTIPMSLANAEEFVGKIVQVSGFKPMIRGGSYLKHIVKDRRESPLFDCPLWLDEINEAPTLPEGWSQFVLWRYTDGSHGLKPRKVQGIGLCSRSLYNNGFHGPIQEFWFKHSNKTDELACNVKTCTNRPQH